MSGSAWFGREAAVPFIHAHHVRLIPAEHVPADTSEVSYSQTETIYGPVQVFSTPEGIFRIDLIAESSDRSAFNISPHWKEQRDPFHDLALQFLGARAWSGPPIPLHVHGTPFQLSVWRALLDIPYGQRTTYGAIAAALGDVNRSRAVGSAVGSNPVAVIIPCHRVVAANGKIGEFRWGREMKRALVNIEDLSVGGTKS